MMTFLTAPIRYPIAAAFGAGIAACLMVAVPLIAHTLEPVLLPVATHWTVETATREGSDLLLSGTMVKRRPCLYTPPVIVRDSTGQNYRMEHLSAIRGTSWATSMQPQRFGPWKIYGGAGKVLTFTSLYECHLLWPTFTELGVFDGRNL
jgi:hypothetical protein